MKRLITLIMSLTLLSEGVGCAKAPAPPEIIPEQIDIVIEVEKEIALTMEPIVEITEEPTIVEYEEATYIWNYFKSLGYNDYVVAGILGNIMVECGGKTLNLQINAENSKHYGMCQWNKKYYSEVIGASLDVQCDYLRDTIQYEINTFGTNGYNYEKFIAIQNERTAALIFAKSYERCAAGGYPGRQDCATIAYNYFTSLK